MTHRIPPVGYCAAHLAEGLGERPAHTVLNGTSLCLDHLSHLPHIETCSRRWCRGRSQHSRVAHWLGWTYL